MNPRSKQLRSYSVAFVAAVWLTLCLGSPATSVPQRFLYVETPRCDLEGWQAGEERFPDGAQIRIAPAGRTLVKSFFATADPDVSFDGQRVLFAGKRQRDADWQIWEVGLNGGEPVLVHAAEQSVRPLYLSGGEIAFARKYDGAFQVAVLDRASAKVRRVTYAPGGALPVQVLRDGRILFEGSHPKAASELYAVYTDGSGVEAVRCDHGAARRHARQLASGDLVFGTDKGLARFTPALARQAHFPAPPGQLGGAVAEIARDRWLISLRATAAEPYALHEWSPAANGAPKKVIQAVANVVNPVVIAPRDVPPRHPSALHDKDGANLLCLNAYESPYPMPAGSIAAIRVFAREAAGGTVLLGQTEVENDGSFYVKVPADRPIRLELTSATGKTIHAQHGWFWMRRGEQRICVGCHAGPERAPENAVPKILLRQQEPTSMMGDAR